MSLQTDRIFWVALKENEDLNEVVEGRIFNTARDNEREEEDKVPYIIITFESLQNDGGTKDDAGESEYDQATVSVLCVANDREQLAAITEEVRDTIKATYASWSQADEEEFGFSFEKYQLSANAIQMDIDKPCIYQTLTYVCETQNL